MAIAKDVDTKSDDAREPSLTSKRLHLEHESWLQAKLDSLDVVEKKIEAVGPRHQLLENLVLLLLLASAIASGVIVSFDAGSLSMSAFGLATLATLVAGVGINARRQKMKSLEWERDQLLSEIGDGSADPTL